MIGATCSPYVRILCNVDEGVTGQRVSYGKAAVSMCGMWLVRVHKFKSSGLRCCKSQVTVN